MAAVDVWCSLCGFESRFSVEVQVSVLQEILGVFVFSRTCWLHYATEEVRVGV